MTRHRFGETLDEGAPTPRALLRALEDDVDPEALRDLRRALPALVADLSRELRSDPLPLAALRYALDLDAALLDAALLAAHLRGEVDLLVAQAPTDAEREAGIETSEGVHAYASAR